MAKSSGDRKAKVAKAGKRSGGFIMPPPLNPSKQAAREAGEQQFVAKEQLTVKKEVSGYLFDKHSDRFVYRTKAVPVTVDFVWDKNRKHAVMSPRFKEVS